MYISPIEYAKLTGNPLTDATENRIKMACYLLDSRIGNYRKQESGFKLVLSELPIHQKESVKIWVSAMIKFLKENNDTIPSAATLKLGRFAVTPSSTDTRKIPEQLSFADAILVSSGIVCLRVGVNP